ncbi:glyoxysomal fatty acid beta-oxidation multifunctional protein MFP-a-like [Dendrobium catenatum]|uniref:glyoxysomal fatty acid beta-oxidation multifunctional protein MFP-a-like n=1 Tax=Dendrobium catenatum TaxID=906689 RepID=UPI0010A0367A|nr:glyoxysomal fatty acid beta-oxidation multifunctional protein MFP-a-like [Dendrobium catenatum]
MMLTSKPVKGKEAYALGLVDAIVPPGDLLITARHWAIEIAECRRPWIKSLYKTDKVGSLREAKEIIKFARAQAQKQSAYLEHPRVCIDVIEEGIVSGPRAGLLKEANASWTLQFSPTSKSLVCSLRNELLPRFLEFLTWV